MCLFANLYQNANFKLRAIAKKRERASKLPCECDAKRCAKRKMCEVHLCMRAHCTMRSAGADPACWFLAATGMIGSSLIWSSGTPIFLSFA